MKRIDQLFNSLNVYCAEIKNNVWDKTQLFLDKMSLFYDLEKEYVPRVNQKPDKKIDDSAIIDSRKKELRNAKRQSETIEQELEFDSMVTIASYLDERDRDIRDLIEFVEKSDFHGKIYQKNLNSFSEEILQLKDKLSKDLKKKDRDELIDGFVSKYLKIIKSNLFETVYDNIYRYSLTSDNNNSSIIEFKEKIDVFMERAGFDKREIQLGDKINTKICSSENPEQNY